MKQGQRKYKILEAIIDSYVVSGEPIGSKTLTELLDIDVSSATIRNDMAELTVSGYLEQPHTSAGRIPSQRGYRMYVDRLMWKRNLTPEAQSMITNSLVTQGSNPQRFLESAARLLSEQTGFAALITSPADSQSAVLGVEIMATGPHTVMLVMMLTPSVMKSRLCRLEIDVDNVALAMIRHQLQRYLLGMKLTALTDAFVDRITEENGEVGRALTPVFTAAKEIAAETLEVQLSLAGLTNLIEREEIPFDETKEVLAFLCRSDELIALLDTSQGTTRVLIGKETKKAELSQVSIVAARYYAGTGAGGWAGIIGPTRMNYAQLIPQVEYFAGMVGRVMRETLCIN